MVTALTERANVRQTVEDNLADLFQKKGYKITKSIEALPPKFLDNKEPDKEALLSKIAETGVDAILTVALVDKETENRYVPGNQTYQPIPRFGYYGTFWGYYNTWYPTLHSPGYYAEDKIYFLETNLYDAKSQALLWSAQSETYNPSGLSKFSKDFASLIITEMEKDGVLKNGK